MYHRVLIILVLALLHFTSAKAQETKPDRDSLRIARDSVRVVQDSLMVMRDSLNTKKDSLTFRALEKYSSKSKFTSIIHHMFFKPVGRKLISPSRNSKINKSKPYRKAEGKIIREINIITQDPFGYDIRDTTIRPKRKVLEAGNAIHFKTRPLVIKNLLLFKTYQVYDSVLVNESVRLIRAQKFVRDVLLYSLPVSKKNDSVDIYIMVSDVWSISPIISFTGKSARAGLTDINFAGLGNRFQGEYIRNRTADYNIGRLSYLISNIRNTYISLNLQYLFAGKDEMLKNFEFERGYYSPETSNLQYLFLSNKDLIRSIEIERPFYSPLTKWAGGIFLGQMIIAQSYIQQDTSRYLASMANIQDYWIAKSWQLFRWKPADGRITSLVLSARLVKTNYPARPPEAEPANLFNNGTVYFAGIGLTSRKFIQERYIYNYGKIEDFPVGRDFGMTIGLDRQDINRIYMGLNAGFGNYYRWGYLSTHIEYGTFKVKNGFEQGVITGRINYFTRLLGLGNWKIRQFVRPSLIFGIHRLQADNLTFRDVMPGFEGIESSASQMIAINIQTQSYPPWNILGFHLGPFIFTSLGMLSTGSSGFSTGPLYASFGLGVLIKNNYLTFNTFQISFIFYPYSPGKGYNDFQMNAYKTNNYGFTDFEITKPSVVEYR